MVGLKNSAMNANPQESFKWWNSQLETCDDAYSPPTIVSSQIAYTIFYQLCPQMMIFDEFIDNDQAYWGEIRRFLSSRFTKISIPDPSENFPEFINILFNLKDKITLNTVNDSLHFLQLYQTAEPSFFVLRQLPLIVASPTIYYETIISLPKCNSFMWTNMIQEIRFVDNFYYMNKNSFTFFPKNSEVSNWNIILLCSSAFSYIFSGAIEYSAKASVFCYYYLRDINSILKFAPDGVNASLLRDSFLIFQSTEKKITLRQKNQIRAKEILLTLVKCDSELTKMFVVFLLSFRSVILSKSEILEIVIIESIRKLSDFDILELICDEKTCKPILTYLYRHMISNQIFHRSCLSLILSILKQYEKDEALQSEAIKFIYGLLIFLNYSTKWKKYQSRSMYICETLSSFLDSDLFWIHDSILSAASTIARLGSVPCYFDLLFPINYKNNSEFSALFSSIKSKNLQLKHFPFVKSKTELVLFETNQPAYMEFKKQISDTVTKLKSIKLKMNANDGALQIGQQVRNIFLYLMKNSSFFPQDFEALLLTILKNHTKITLINAYQLVRAIQLLFEERSPSTIYKIVEILRFGIESKNLISLYEYGVISKSYGKQITHISILAINKLLEIDLQSVHAIQTLRRILKSLRMSNEFILSIILSLLGSGQKGIQVEAIKTLPYLLNQDFDLVSVYKNLKGELMSTDKDIQYFASKSLAYSIYSCNDLSLSQTIFSRLIKKENRIVAFSNIYQIYLQYFRINEVQNNIDEWALFLFLLAIDESYSIDHLSMISKIIIVSHIHVFGSNLNFLAHFIRSFCEDDSVNFDEISDFCLVVILNAFLFGHSSFKFMVKNKELFYNSLKKESKEIRLLSAQCFEKVAKLKPELALTFLRELLMKQKTETEFYYQAISLLLKHIEIDDEISQLIISNKSELNVIQLSFLPYQNDNEFIGPNRSTKPFYLAFYISKHYLNLNQSILNQIMKSFLIDLTSRSNSFTVLIYQIVLKCHLTYFYEQLLDYSIQILQKVIKLTEDEFDRRFLFNLDSINFPKKFSDLLIEGNLFETIIQSYQTMFFELPKENQQNIINHLFSNLNSDDVIVLLILINEIMCKKTMLLLPTDGISILLSVNRNQKTIKYISMCLSKWVSLFPDSITACYISFLDSDPRMFSAFLKFYSPFITEKQIEYFMVHLLIYLNSNPMAVLDSISSFVGNKNVSREMKKKISTILEEMLSFDFILSPNSLESMYENIIALNPSNINKFAISLFHSPINRSIARFYAVKLMQTVPNNPIFYANLDQLIDNSSLYHSKLLFELLAIRNQIENVPLMLLLYQQTNDERIKTLILKSFLANHEVSSWISLVTSILIEDTLKYSIRPSIEIKKLMITITKMLINRIREMYPFNVMYIDKIIDISFELLKHKKWKQKSLSILSVIIDSFINTEEISLISQRIQSYEEQIINLLHIPKSIVQFHKIFFSLFRLYLKLNNENSMILIEKVNNLLIELESSLVLYIRTVCLIREFIDLPTNFGGQIDIFFKLIFEKKCSISDLKTELPLFIDLLNSNEQLRKAPKRIIQLLIIEQINYQCNDYLLESLGKLLDNENCFMSLSEIKNVFYQITSNESSSFGFGLQLFLTNLVKTIPSNSNSKWQSIWQSTISFSIMKPNSIYFTCLAYLFHDHLSQKYVIKCGPPVFHMIVSSNYDEDYIVALSSIIFDKMPNQYIESLLNELIESAHRANLIQRILRIAFIRYSSFSLLNQNLAIYLQMHFTDIGFPLICNLLCNEETVKQGVVIADHFLPVICSLSYEPEIESWYLNFFNMFLIKAKQMLKKNEMETISTEILKGLLNNILIWTEEARPLILRVLKKIPTQIISVCWPLLDTESRHQITEKAKQMESS